MIRRFALVIGILAAFVTIAAAASFDEAQAHFKAGRYEQALDAYNAFLQADPSDPALVEQVRYQKVLCLWRVKKDLFTLDEAAGQFMAAYPDNKNLQEVAYYKAMSATLQLDNWIHARDAFAQFLTVYGRKPSPWKDLAQLELARAMVGCGDFEQAKSMVASTLSARPDHPKRLEMRFQAGMADFKNENYRAAAEAFQRLAADTESSTATVAQDARFHSGLAKYNEAVQAQDAHAAPDIVNPLFDEARARLDRVIAAAPADSDEARWLRATIFKRRGDAAGYEAAVKETPVLIAYKEAIEPKKKADWRALETTLPKFLANEGKAPSKWKDTAELDLVEAMNRAGDYESTQKYVAQKLAERPDHPKRVAMLFQDALAERDFQRWTAAIEKFKALEAEARAKNDDYYEAYANYSQGTSMKEEANRLQAVAGGPTPESTAMRASALVKLRNGQRNGKMEFRWRIYIYYWLDDYEKLKAEATAYLGLPEKAATPLIRSQMMNLLGIVYCNEQQFDKARMWLDKSIEEYQRYPEEASGVSTPATNSIIWELCLCENAKDTTRIKQLLDVLMTMPDDARRTQLLWNYRKYLDDLAAPPAEQPPVPKQE